MYRMDHRHRNAALLLLGIALAGGLLGLAWTYTSQVGQNYGEACFFKTSDDFWTALESEERLAVMFSSENCPTCKELEPYWLKLCKEQPGGARVSIIKLSSETVDVFTEYGITGTPTFIVYQEGLEVNRLVGKFPGDQLESMRSFISLDTVGLESGGEAKPLQEESEPHVDEAGPNLLPLLIIATPLVAGFLASLSPCVFPVMVSYVAGLASSQTRPRRLELVTSPLLAALGAIAMGATFLVLGVYAPGLGNMLLGAAGATLVAAGFLELMGTPTYITLGFKSRRGMAAFSFTYGLLSVQCSLPLVAGALFAIAAGGAGYGGLALLAFAAGVAMPVAITLATLKIGRLSFIVNLMQDSRFLKAGYAGMALGGVVMLFYGFGLL